MTPQIVIGDDVAAELGPDQTALVRAGDAAPPVYECLVCRQPGDMRTEPAAAVLFLGDDTMILSWVHHRCGPSTVHPVDQMQARYGRPDDDGQPTGPVDLTWTTLARLSGGIYPTLTIMPGQTTRAVLPAGPAEHLVLDSALEELRAAGFGPVDLSGGADPAQVPRWAVRVDAGRLSAITRPGGPWWASHDTPAMPADWRQAARRTREVFLMVVAPGALPDLDQISVDDTQDALQAAARNGHLVGALLPLRGTLS